MQLIKRTPDIDLDDPTATEFGGIQEGFKFDNVFFKYTDANKYALNGVSFDIPKGQTVAIVGPSGSGKSTIAKLVERFYDPTSGDILIDNQDLKSVSLRQYRNKIGYVGQEPCLFNETIRDNMLNSNPEATEEDIVEALKKAHAWDFVNKLRDGIDTHVGAVGGRLSGGQKQRIAIARALVRNPDLLIFDEATSALDMKSEEKVQKAIDSIAQSYTKIVIAHRLTTVKKADKIIVLEDGEIIEQGTHDSLKQQNGVYADLNRIQDAALNTKTTHVPMIDNANPNVDHEALTDKDEEQGADEHENLLGSNENGESHLEGSQEEEEQELGLFTVMKRLYGYMTPKYLIPLVIFGATFVGGGMCLITYPQVKLLMRIILNDTGDYIKNGIAIYIPILAGMCVIMFLAQMLTRAALHVINSNLIESIRSNLYDKLINQPLEFYDNKDHNIGNLTAILSSNVRELNGASIEIYVFMYGAVAGMISGITIAFVFEWNFGLLLCGITPVSAIAVGVTFSLQYGSQSGTKETESLQEKMVSDYVCNYATVASLANEDIVISRYFANNSDEEISYTLTPENFSEAFWPALTCGFGLSFFLLGYFFCCLIAAHNVQGGRNVEHQLMCIIAFAYSFVAVSFMMVNTPDFGRSFRSARKIIAILEEVKEGHVKSPIQNGAEDLESAIAQGDIEFHHVWFRYPTADPDMWVLRDFCLKINAGESIGLAGESGCGKSTVTALIYRFYEPQEGYITIGGRPITEFTLNSLRARFGFVQQEPLLFNTTILENICYGVNTASQENTTNEGIQSVNSEQILNATKIANAAEFINKKDFDGDDNIGNNADISENHLYDELPDGYKTICGSKGNKLSGGQKQRIAIARAVIRNPDLLILDEATSALDENSQKIVQEALDQVMTQRTSIVIAHRLSTLGKCQRIVRIERGVIAEDKRQDSRKE